ncbi:hypothetical protein [Mycobacterium sp. SMC-4]|uniref:hypothetical protein n=1 Tax=Mycobacterium sp. SMC-4 TaxID=2857059 RepID=UPI0021B432B2|nr:hypothetical protein [Mycobacterium sp. SMC-4]UXA19550.1 hypothetical protein KXD98_08110 [Mycobacterium sp. SMC-4]
MARRGVRESARDIEKQLRLQIAARAELDAANAELAENVKAEVQSHIPIDQGDAVGSIQIKKLKNTREHPLPGRLVYSDSPMFHMLEYGTKADPDSTQDPRRVQMPDGSWVTLGPDTPTQAVAPFGKARAKFGDKIR